MIHDAKKCDPCGAEFHPPAYLTPAQAAATRSCSHACSAARSNGASTGPGQNGRDIGDDGGICVCEDCRRLRTSDRSALIAAYAAKTGLPVAVGPRVPLTPSQLSRRAYRIRKRRLESYEPVFSDESCDEAIA